MRRSYLAYVIVAVIPSVAAVVAGVIVGDNAWRDLRTSAWSQVGTTALNAFQEDLVGAVSVLAASAEPTPVDPEDPAWERVSGGDTISALRPRASGAEVMVITGPLPGDPPGTLRYAGAPIPTAPLVVARTAGARLTVYLNGQRALSTPDSLGPDSLPRPTLMALSATSGGLTVAGAEGGALVALDHPVGVPPSVAVMVGPATPPDAPFPRPLLLVVSLLFLFACLVGWIQLGASRTPKGSATNSTSLTLLVVSVVPLITAVGFLVQADRLFHDATRVSAARGLSRALAVASVRDVVGSPTAFRELTGYHASRIRDGVVEETTLAEPLDALAALSPPPPSFSSTGTVVTSDGPSIYVALRLSGGDFLVATARRPDGRARAFRRSLLLIAAVFGAWVLVTGWMAGVGAGPPADPSEGLEQPSSS